VSGAAVLDPAVRAVAYDQNASSGTECDKYDTQKLGCGEKKSKHLFILHFDEGFIPCFGSHDHDRALARVGRVYQVARDDLPNCFH